MHSGLSLAQTKEANQRTIQASESAVLVCQRAQILAHLSTKIKKDVCPLTLSVLRSKLQFSESEAIVYSQPSSHGYWLKMKLRSY